MYTNTVPTTAAMADTRYHQIRSLIEAEINEILSDTDEEYDGELNRDELISQYMDFLKKDLQSDNA